MERGEEEWTTAHKVTDCLVAESPLCPSFLDIFLATHTRSGCQERVQSPWAHNPRVSLHATSSCPLSSCQTVRCQFLKPHTVLWALRGETERGRREYIHKISVSLWTVKCSIGLVVILARDGEARAGCGDGGGRFLFPQWNGARGVPSVHVLGSWGFIGS